MALHLGLKAQRDPAVLVLLMHAHAGQARRGDGGEIDIAPDARVGKPRAPVPAEHAVGLAQQREAHGRVRGALHAALGVALLHRAVGRFEGDLDEVLALSDEVHHVHRPGAVHVVGKQQLLTVDGHRRYGVQALAGEQQRVAAQIGLGQVEGAAIDVVLLHQVEGLLLVVAPEGILHAARVQQICIDRAGHRRRNPLLLVCRAHLPCAV